MTKQRVRVVADVAYTPPPPGTDAPGRLASTIAGACLEVQLGRRFGWGPVRVPLPLKGEGWLEVISPYLPSRGDDAPPHDLAMTSPMISPMISPHLAR